MVVEDQPIVEVMTDKATVTITAPKAGVVVETLGKVGEIVPVHSVLVVFELDGARPGPPVHTNGTKAHPPDPEPAATAVGDLRETLPGMTAAGYFNDRPLATPATRKLARDMEVDLRRVPPSGPAGRVTRADVEGFRHAPEPPRPAPPSARELPVASDGPREERVPLVGMRRRIAQKMAQSKSTAAHYTFVEECDATALKTLRARLKDPAEAQGVKLSFLPFVVKAVVAGLKKHPIAQHDPRRGPGRDRLPQVLPYRDRDRDRRGARRTRREGRRPEEHPRDRAGDRTPRAGGACGQGQGRRALRIDLHHHVAGREGRSPGHADHQLSRSRHPGRAPDEDQAGRAGRVRS